MVPSSGSSQGPDAIAHRSGGSPQRDGLQKRRENWVEGQRRRRASALFRRLDHSFALRLMLAVVAALTLLGLVNRFENCHVNRGDPDCLTSNALDVISVGNVESLSIVTAAFLFILEGSRRRRREHREALELLMACRQAGVVMSIARVEALEDLNRAGLWLDGFDLSGTNLEGLQAEGGRWRRVNLTGAMLRGAHFSGSDLRGAILRGADLRGADLRETDLKETDLREADLREADLSAADLRGSRLEGALLEGAQFDSSLLSEPGP
jgi:hypothetical protein